MIVSLIVAQAADRAIGRNNDLLWHLPADMKFFKDTTRGHHVLMGRKNYLSIPEKFRPLPGRPNLILTRQAGYEAPGCTVIHDLQSGIEFAKNVGEEELFIIGGGQVYELALNQGVIDKMYITEVDAQFPDAEAFFPDFDATDWNVQVLSQHPADERHNYSFIIKEYTRNK